MSEIKLIQVPGSLKCQHPHIQGDNAIKPILPLWLTLETIKIFIPTMKLNAVEEQRATEIYKIPLKTKMWQNKK
ncbi:MAG: hypothetical protein IPO22_19435 [Anaerolineales bacterium]|nr:hypothetical protein [Anaerolineales bacterium]